jgi:hypothetical protein
MIRSVEERSGGGQKRSLPDKAHKSAMDAVLHMESKNSHHHHHDSPLTANGGVASAAGEKLGAERLELPRIYISLSRKEKEDDFLAMKGTKLPQRPKKRAKNVDKSLQVRPLLLNHLPSPRSDPLPPAPFRSQNLHVLLRFLFCVQFVFPGMWLSDLTKGRYEVREKKCVKKVQIQSAPIWSSSAHALISCGLFSGHIIFRNFQFRVAERIARKEKKKGNYSENRLELGHDEGLGASKLRNKAAKQVGGISSYPFLSGWMGPHAGAHDP